MSRVFWTRLAAGCLFWSSMFAVSLSGARLARADDPTIDQCIGANDRAIDLRKRGKLLQSRKEFALCASSSCSREISDACQKGIEEVNRVLPSIVFVPKNSANEDIPGVRLFVDGVLSEDRMDGAALVLDPGEHSFRFEAAGQPAVTKLLVLREGETSRIEPILIGPPAPSPPKPPEAKPTPVEIRLVQSPAPTLTRLDSTGSFQRTMGTLFLAVGLPVTIIGAGVQALDATSKWASAQHDCVPSACGPGSAAQKERRDAETSANWTNIWVAGAAVALVGGIVLRVTAPARRLVPVSAELRVAPIATPHGGAVVLRGSFQ